MRQRLARWLRAFWLWLKSLTPGGRGRMVENAVNLGFRLGQEALLEAIACMSRDQRRTFIRQLTDKKRSLVETIPEDSRIVIP